MVGVSTQWLGERFQVNEFLVEPGENTLTFIPKLYVKVLSSERYNRESSFEIQGAREIDRALFFVPYPGSRRCRLARFLVLMLSRAYGLNCHRYLGIYSYKLYEMNSSAKTLLLQKICLQLI